MNKDVILRFERFSALFKRRILWLIAACALALFSLCSLYFWILPTQYMARSAMLLSHSMDEGKISTDPEHYVSSLEFSASFVSYMEEGFLFEKAAKQLPDGLSRPYSAEELADSISVNLNEMTVSFEFSVVTENASDSLILCEFFSVFSLQTISELTQVGRYAWTEQPYLDESYLHTAGFVPLAAVLVLICVSVYLLAILWLAFRRNRLQDREDLTARYPINLLGEVPAIPSDT